MTPRHKRHFTRTEREHMIVLAFAVKIRATRFCWMTCAQVAKAIGMRRSSHLDRILWGMVDKGYLSAREVERNGRWKGVEYMLAPATFQSPEDRIIPVKRAGIAKGQLRLW